MSLSVGARFAGYRVERHLARGGMGDVYLAWHEVLQRRDAVKILRPEFADDPIFRERFLREANLAALVKHPSIVTVYTAGEVAGRMYIASEYIAGGDLRERLSVPLDPEDSVRIVAAVADALDAAHRHGLVHRDVKPENLLVTQEQGRIDRVFLIDFGITRLQKATTTLTDKQSLLGTVGYIAPEQILGTRVDGRADQYSLACLAFECLTGRLPFPNLGQPATLRAHLEAAVPKASERGAGLPSAIDAVLQRALAKSPAQRFETCSQFASALVTALGQPDMPPSLVGGTTGAVADLAVVGGPQSGLRLALTAGTLVVGRSDAADLRVPDRFMSRRHFQLDVDPQGSVRVSDAGSANGTYVDGTRLTAGRELRAHEWIEAGSSLLAVMPHRSPTAARTADDGQPVAYYRSERRPTLEGAPESSGPRFRRRKRSADSQTVRHLRDATPDAPALAIAAMDRTPDLWTRRCDEPDALRLRIGAAASQPESAAVPLCWDLLRDGTLRLTGEPDLCHGLLRWLVVQACCLISPDELDITVALPTEEVFDWSWLTLLNHLKDQRGAVRWAAERVGSERLIGAAAASVADRRARTIGPHARPLPLMLVVADARLMSNDLARLVQASGPTSSAAVVLLDTTDDCSGLTATRLHLDAEAQLSIGDQAGAATPDGVTPEWSREVALALSRLVLAQAQDQPAVRG